MLETILKKAEEAKNTLDKALKYLRINDDKGMLSLTNIAMILILYKIAMTPAVSFMDIAGLATAVMGYQAKRAIEGKNGKET